MQFLRPAQLPAMGRKAQRLASIGPERALKTSLSRRRGLKRHTGLNLKRSRRHKVSAAKG